MSDALLEPTIFSLYGYRSSSSSSPQPCTGSSMPARASARQRVAVCDVITGFPNLFGRKVFLRCLGFLQTEHIGISCFQPVKHMLQADF